MKYVHCNLLKCVNPSDLVVMRPVYRSLSAKLEAPELTSEEVNNSGHVTITSQPGTHNASGGTEPLVLIPMLI